MLLAGRFCWRLWILLILVGGGQAIGSAASPANVLRLGYFPNITHAQALYARGERLLERRLECPIRWVPFLAGPAVIEALFTDSIDAAFIGPGPTINGYQRSRGEKFVVIAGAASGGTGLVVRDDAGIRSDGDFGGQTIATPQLGNTQDVAARHWFQSHGYQLKEKGGNLTLIALSNSDLLDLFRRGQVAGAWSVEPWISRLEHEARGRLFLDERTLWPEGRYVTTHLVMTKSFLAEQPQQVRILLQVLVEVTQTLNTNKASAGRSVNQQLKVETGRELAPEVLSNAMARVEFTWDPIATSLYRSAAMAHEVGFLKTAPDLKGIYALHSLNDVLQAKGLPMVGDGRPEKKKKE